MTVQTRKTTLELVGIKPKSLEEYRSIVGDGLVEEARTLARELGSLRLLHLSSTATGVEWPNS